MGAGGGFFQLVRYHRISVDRNSMFEWGWRGGKYVWGYTIDCPNPIVPPPDQDVLSKLEMLGLRGAAKTENMMIMGDSK